jgi:hypothetical protein
VAAPNSEFDNENEGMLAMHFRQAKQLLPLLFSGIAVFVSLSTLYLTQLRPGTVNISAGEAMQVWHNTDEEIFITMSVVFRNTGSQPLTINSLAMIIKDPNSDDALFLKYWGVKRFDQSKPGVNLVYESRRFTPLTIPPREEVAKFIDFYGGPPGRAWIPRPARYDIYILGWTNGQVKPSLRAKVLWSFSDEDVTGIKENIANRSGDIVQGRLIFKQSYGGEPRNLSLLEFKNLTE